MSEEDGMAECNVCFRRCRLEEGRIENGEWSKGRVLNGDEQMSLRFGDMPGALMVELYQF